MTKPTTAARYIWRDQNDQAAAQAASDEAGHYNDLPSLTKQSFTDDADINIVMQRFGITDGSLDPSQIRWEEIDLSDAGDFQSIQNQMVRAKELFMQLPADLRYAFNNDPAQMFDWVRNPDNLEEAIELGFLKRQEEAAPAPPPEPPQTQQNT